MKYRKHNVHTKMVTKRREIVSKESIVELNSINAIYSIKINK